MTFFKKSESANLKMLQKSRELKGKVEQAITLGMVLNKQMTFEFSDAGIDLTGLNVSSGSDLQTILQRINSRIGILESLVVEKRGWLYSIFTSGTFWTAIGSIATVVGIAASWPSISSVISPFSILKPEAKFCSIDQLRVRWGLSEEASATVSIIDLPKAVCNDSVLSMKHNWILQASSCGSEHVVEGSGGAEFPQNQVFQIQINSRNSKGVNQKAVLEAVSPRSACLCSQSSHQPPEMSCQKFQCDSGFSFSKGSSSDKTLADIFFETEVLPDDSITKVFLVAPNGIRLLENKYMCDIESGSSDGLVNRIQIYGPNGYAFNTRSTSFLVKGRNGGLFKMAARGKGPFRIAQESNGSMMMVGLYLDWFASEPNNFFKY